MPRRKRDKSAQAAAFQPEAAATVEDLVNRIQSEDGDVRTAAWRSAGSLGADAVEPLADLTSHESMEVARAAKRGLWHIVRYCGRPGAEAERQAVNTALVKLLSADRSAALRREAIWMISELGDDQCVPPVANLLSDAELREDARMALERIPGGASLEALTAGLDAAPDEFKPNLADSLRNRGEHVPGIPSMKMTPVKPTAVQPL